MPEGSGPEENRPSTRLTRADVLRMARMHGLSMKKADADEALYRINALLDALSQIDDADLAGIDPLPILVLPEDR